jgi:SAM-dependent methyltransferase
MSGAFDDYAAYYDLVYSDKNYAAEAAHVAGLLKQHGVSGKAILDLGSGTGRHAAGLASTGFIVHGIERSGAMLAAAEASTPPGCSFSLGDLRDVRLDRKFDAALSLFHVMSYQTTNSDFAEALATARAHLNPGGILLFDYWYGPAVLHEKPSVRVKRVSGDSIEVTRIAKPTLLPEANVVVVDYHLFVRELGSEKVSEYDEQHRLRYFFLPEIELFLNGAGFRLEKCEEWLSGHRLGLDTWSAMCVARVD